MRILSEISIFIGTENIVCSFAFQEVGLEFDNSSCCFCAHFSTTSSRFSWENMLFMVISLALYPSSYVHPFDFSPLLRLSYFHWATSIFLWYFAPTLYNVLLLHFIKCLYWQIHSANTRSNSFSLLSSS